MRSLSRSYKIPIPIIEGLEKLRQPGQPLDDYPSTNALIVGLLRYALAFPRRHTLTAGIARLYPAEQDMIDDFLCSIAANGGSLADLVSKPATAEKVLALAKERRASKP